MRNRPWVERTVPGLLAGFPVVLWIDPVRHAIESRMALHMLVEFPWLLTAGWLCARRWLLARPLSIDSQGLLGITVTTCVMAFWMIPASLDLALMSTPMQGAKYLSWLSAGALLGWGSQRRHPVTASFFLLNAAWMLVTAGLLYLDADSPLCVNYLVGDQWLAGHGLIAAGVMAGAAALWVLKPWMEASGCGPSPAQSRAKT